MKTSVFFITYFCIGFISLAQCGHLVASSATSMRQYSQMNTGAGGAAGSSFFLCIAFMPLTIRKSRNATIIKFIIALINAP